MVPAFARLQKSSPGHTIMSVSVPMFGVARASYFPSLSLTGFFGNVSPELGKIFSNGKTWDLDAGLLGPIFAAGRIKRNYEAAQARYPRHVAYRSELMSARTGSSLLTSAARLR